jgi:hypothetical protein
MRQFIAFYANSLLNPYWVDIVTLQRDNTFVARMTFQGLNRQRAHAVWQPFVGGVVASGSDLSAHLLWNDPSAFGSGVVLIHQH